MSPQADLPLTGVRVLDLSQFIAGPLATRFLADLGAEVFKVEWKDRLDNIRFNPPYVELDGEEPVPIVVAGVAASMVPSENRSGLFNEMNAGKRGVAANLKSPEGIAVFEGLLRECDVLVENFSSGTMERLGLTEQRLREINPTLVYARASAFGTYGGREGVSYGPTAEAESGLTFLSGLPDREPAGWGYAFMDETAAYMLAFAITSALHAQREEAAFSLIDLAQVGSAILHTGVSVLRHSVTGQPTQRVGNAAPYDAMSPHGVFPCRGQDRWIAVAVPDDARWSALCELMGRADLAEQGASLADRLREQDRIADAVSSWTAAQDAYELMARLQEQGIPAGVCQTAGDRALRDPQLRERGFLRDRFNSEVGWRRSEQPPVRFSRTSVPAVDPTSEIDGEVPLVARAAPAYGEDMDYVEGLLSAPRRRVAAASGLLGRGPSLKGVRVVELAGEHGEYCGRLLAGVGAEVIKVEPPGGAATRSVEPIGPDGESLYFRQYNLGKRSVVIDTATPAGRAELMSLVGSADILLETLGPGDPLRGLLDPETLAQSHPALVHCSITPFGRSGPYADFEATDLVSLAMGGQVMVCGYDPVSWPDGGAPTYDTPPIAAGGRQSVHMVGTQTATALIAALLERGRSGLGQHLDVSVHEACAGATEIALPFWLYGEHAVHRQTSRQAWPYLLPPTTFECADGRYVYLTYIGAPVMWTRFVSVLEELGLAHEVGRPEFADYSYRGRPASIATILQATRALCSRLPAEEVVGLGQALNLPWGVIRRPEENAAEPHWRQRGVIVELAHADGSRHDYLGSPWVSETVPWVPGPCAPELGDLTLDDALATTPG